MLRLVRDEPPKPPRRKGQPSPPALTREEEARFRAAVRNLRDAFGSWPCLAAAMETTMSAIQHMLAGRSVVSGDMVIKAMKASGLSFAELIGGPVAADRCRACGKVRAA